MSAATCPCFDQLGRSKCLCHEYTAGGCCTVVDETAGTMPWELRYCDATLTRLHPEVGPGHAMCLAHEMDPRVHITSYRGTTRIIIPSEDDS